MPKPPRSKEILEQARKEAHQELSRFVQTFDLNKKLAVDYLDSTTRLPSSRAVEVQVNLKFMSPNE